MGCAASTPKHWHLRHYLSPQSPIHDPKVPIDLSYWLIYFGVGIFVGFFAGLLGIGGGSVTVPILSLIFIAKGYPPAHVIHMALGTSLAVIIIGSFASAREHHLHQAVNWKVVKTMAPGILLGTFGGAVFAYFASTRFLKFFFVGFIFFLALQLILDIKPKRHMSCREWADYCSSGLSWAGCRAWQVSAERCCR
jgi:uncharacterized membrane protein YfcA